MTLCLRPETPADIDAIDALTRAAFRDAPHTDHTEQFIVKALRAAGALTLSLVAELDGTLLGHVALSPVSLSDGTPGWFGLGPISVSPAQQGRGIGSQLMRAALQALQAQGAAGCVLLGDPGFYARFGFRAEPGLVLPEVPPEYFQALSFGAPLPRGVVSYHAAFAAQG
ncbi:Acetyltransferase (GNAT) family protein [compost metagenome]